MAEKREHPNFSRLSPLQEVSSTTCGSCALCVHPFVHIPSKACAQAAWECRSETTRRDYSTTRVWLCDCVCVCVFELETCVKWWALSVCVCVFVFKKKEIQAWRAYKRACIPLQRVTTVIPVHNVLSRVRVSVFEECFLFHKHVCELNRWLYLKKKKKM